MKTELLIIQAEKFLIKKHIKFLKPAILGENESDRIEIIFMRPETLDPNIVIDPPDIRVWVYKITGEVEFIAQM